MEQNQTTALPTASPKNVLMTHVVTPAIWLSIGVALGMVLANKKKGRIQ